MSYLEFWEIWSGLVRFIWSLYIWVKLNIGKITGVKCVLKIRNGFWGLLERINLLR